MKDEIVVVKRRGRKSLPNVNETIRLSVSIDHDLLGYYGRDYIAERLFQAAKKEYLNIFDSHKKAKK